MSARELLPARCSAESRNQPRTDRPVHATSHHPLPHPTPSCHTITHTCTHTHPQVVRGLICPQAEQRLNVTQLRRHRWVAGQDVPMTPLQTPGHLAAAGGGRRRAQEQYVCTTPSSLPPFVVMRPLEAPVSVGPSLLQFCSSTVAVIATAAVSVALLLVASFDHPLFVHAL